VSGSALEPATTFLFSDIEGGRTDRRADLHTGMEQTLERLRQMAER